MKFELLVSTMHKSVDDVKKMLVKMNVHCDCLVINQCDEENYYEEIINNKFILRVFSTKERGLSNSRNMALNNARADIVGIADDDLFYYDDFDKTITDFYLKHKDSEIVLFNMDDCYKEFPDKNLKCSFFSLTGYKSVQTTFLLKKIRDVDVDFNTYFGTGSKHFQSGEENIFLADCFRKKLKIQYCKEKILKRKEGQSSWFKGFNDRKFIFDRGAIYYAISKFFYYPYIIRFALKNRKKIKPFSILDGLNIMRAGKKEYRRLLKNR